jgi:3-dehydroquinate dehydratase-2
MKKKILIINGPNLNLLHIRDQKIYGGFSLDKAEKNCKEVASELGLEVHFKQSNNESEIVDLIQKAINNFDGIIINAAAYTHTSVAIHDALEIFTGAKIELHISNIFKREEFRHHSFISKVVDGVICGFGIEGYPLSILAINNLIK